MPWAIFIWFVLEREVSKASSQAAHQNCCPPEFVTSWSEIRGEPVGARLNVFMFCFKDTGEANGTVMKYIFRFTCS